MLSSAPSQTSQSRRQPATRIPVICVVDPKADDYQGWDSLAQGKGAKFQIVASAEESLRLARTTTVDLWVVNVTLPGMSGIDLCQMLKREFRPAAVYLTTDSYSVAEERAALVAGATMYLCKPLDRELLLPTAPCRSPAHS